MKLLIGLGNPGKKYNNNRHNFGFMAADAIASGLKAPDYLEKFGGLLTKADGAYIFKPLSFMNNSGIPASDLANFYKISPNDVYVFYDELDIELGRVKIKSGGGDGGHNGIKSLDSHLGKNYWRVRLGIGHPGHKDLVHGYVLGDFTNADKEIAQKVTKNIADNIDILIKGDRELFLTKFFMEHKPIKPIPPQK